MSLPMRSSFRSRQTPSSRWSATRFWNTSAIPQRVMSEIRRVLTPGGYLHLVTPFCHPYHAYPNDFRRFSIEGLKELAGPMEVVAEGWRTGPTATLLVIAIEYVKLLLRFRAWRA